MSASRKRRAKALRALLDIVSPNQRCATCGHADYHCPGSGCNQWAHGEWCDCKGFVDPRTREVRR